MIQMWGKLALILSLILGGSSMSVTFPPTSTIVIAPKAPIAVATVKTNVEQPLPVTSFINPNASFMEVHAPVTEIPVVVKSSVPTSTPITPTLEPTTGTTFQTAIPSSMEGTWHKANPDYEGCLYIRATDGVIEAECGG